MLDAAGSTCVPRPASAATKASTERNSSSMPESAPAQSGAMRSSKAIPGSASNPAE
ncbi:hypothetical protein AHiyo1_17540 [Arthrobacter sp. Hiyo1]|nr:hypothetical protein AHiyo1_17540 [Arthrobacter sp. Hiyo1]